MFGELTPGFPGLSLVHYALSVTSLGCGWGSPLSQVYRRRQWQVSVGQIPVVLLGSGGFCDWVAGQMPLIVEYRVSTVMTPRGTVFEIRQCVDV